MDHDHPSNPLNLQHHCLFPYFDQDLTHLYSDNLQFFNLLDMNRASPLTQDQYYFSELGFPYFDPIDEDLSLWNDFYDDVDLPLLSYYNDDQSIESHSGREAQITATSSGGGRNGGRRSRPLELEEIEMHFEMPIAMAAEKMQVGLTMLKKRCRELNIKRWPHRKLKSIKSLMQNVKEMGLNEEMEMLEEQKRMIKKVPEMELTKRTKKLRQACFKANYKKRRSDVVNL